MGAFDGAECSELIGLFMLNRVVHEKKIFKPEEIILYRDDVLSMSEGDGPTMERKSKAFKNIFKQEKLNVTCETNLTRVKFLDVLFDLKENSYKPYHKANSKVRYVSSGSNHPCVVLNNIPIGINQRLRNISSDAEAFNSEKRIFQEALYSAGHKHELSFHDRKRKIRFGPSSKRKHKESNSAHSKERDVIWYAPPFDLFSATNIG